MKIFFKTLVYCILGITWATHAAALCVVVPKTTLHEGPGFDYPQTSWELSVYTPLRKIDTWDTWYKVVDVDGDTHWVHTSAVASGSFCLIIKVDRTPLREGPDTRYDPIREAKKYEVFRFARRKGKWIQAADEDGNGFWLLASATWVQ